MQLMVSMLLTTCCAVQLTDVCVSPHATHTVTSAHLVVQLQHKLVNQMKLFTDWGHTVHAHTFNTLLSIPKTQA